MLKLNLTILLKYLMAIPLENVFQIKILAPPRAPPIFFYSVSNFH
jgi:hypothetical protein